MENNDNDRVLYQQKAIYYDCDSLNGVSSDKYVLVYSDSKEILNEIM